MKKVKINIDYNAARIEYLDSLTQNPGVVSILEFGEIEAPGLSDIDWLIIINDQKIKDSSFIFLNNETSNNTKNAFQHRPIVFPEKSVNNICEFFIPTKYKLQHGKDFDLLKDKSINPYLRDITVGYEFFKRQKNLLREPVYQKLTKKKQISLFVSIANHRNNSIFSGIKQLISYHSEIKTLRKDYFIKNILDTRLSNIRDMSIKTILLIEKYLDIELKKNFEKLPDLEIKKSRSVDYSENVTFNHSKKTLVKSLGLFPLLYRMKYNNYNSEFDYFPFKYSLVKQSRDILLQIGLKDGLVADLGFNNWFPTTIKDRLYRIKMSLKHNF